MTPRRFLIVRCSCLGVLVGAITACFAGSRDSPRSGAPAALDVAVPNLRAFAKLYGYVRYFHPSDEAASIDWDRFAVYGAGEARRARNPRELRELLDRLFAPLAPSAIIYDEGTEPRTAFADQLAW